MKNSLFKIFTLTICLCLTVISINGPVGGFDDKSHYFIIPFGFFTMFIIAIRRWNLLYSHLIWFLFWVVSVQQLYRVLQYYELKDEFQTERNYALQILLDDLRAANPQVPASVKSETELIKAARDRMEAQKKDKAEKESRKRDLLTK